MLINILMALNFFIKSFFAIKNINIYDVLIFYTILLTIFF